MASLLTFERRGYLPVLRQTEAAECGLACLAMISSYYGHRIDLNSLRRRYPVSLKGVTLKALIQLAGQMHLTCRPLRFFRSVEAFDRCCTRALAIRRLSS